MHEFRGTCSGGSGVDHWVAGELKSSLCFTVTMSSLRVSDGVVVILLEMVAVVVVLSVDLEESGKEGMCKRRPGVDKVHD